MNNQKWYGFTEDKVFGWVMQNKEFCKYVIQAILPELDIAEIEDPEGQKEINRPNDNSKDVRLDILVKDTSGRLYDIEMQVSNNHNLGQRMRYYQSRLDSFSLESGKSYQDLSRSYIIFLCDFDYFGKNKMRYSFHLYEDQDKSLMLNNNANNIIINAKGSPDGQNQNLIDLVSLINGVDNRSNKFLDFANTEIEKINNDPKRRSEIMDYETKILEEKRISEEKGRRETEAKNMKSEMNLLQQIIHLRISDGVPKDKIYQDLSKQDLIISKDELQKLVDSCFSNY